MADSPSIAASGGWIPPMKATIGQLPSGSGWGFELKWDGMRLEALCDDRTERLTLRSLSGRDVTSSFPELDGLPASLGTSAVLDGEAVVFDGDRPAFGLLQHRMHVDTPTQRLVSEHPIVYILFDLLELDGRSLIGLPLSTRREILRQVVDDGPSWRVPPIVEGDGAPLLTLAEGRGLEGVVAKRLDSTYQPGTRTTEWLKVKIRRRQEFVVVGWLGGQGTLAGSIGSLLLAVWEGESLSFVGAVGSGIGQRDRDRLTGLIEPTDEVPFGEVPALDREPHWIKPTVVVEVEYGSWPEGASLRHPVYAGLRTDREPEGIIRELPP